MLLENLSTSEKCTRMTNFIPLKVEVYFNWDLEVQEETNQRLPNCWMIWESEEEEATWKNLLPKQVFEER